MILVTGANGYIGSHCLAHLLEKGVPEDDVLILSRQPSSSFATVTYDPARRLAVDLEGYDIEAVLHLGATAPKGDGEGTTVDYLDNVYSTLRLLSSLRNVPKRFIFASSVSVYGEYDGEKSEESVPFPSSPYGLSKLLCEVVLHDWAQKNQVGLSILRIGSVYGPGDDGYKKIARSFLECAVQNRPIVINSDGKELRNMVYIDDLVKMVGEVVLSGADTGIINLVADDAITVLDLANLAIRVARSRSIIDVRSEGVGRNDSYSPRKKNAYFGDLNNDTGYADGLRRLLASMRECDDNAI